jgi:hypothetical protein
VEVLNDAVTEQRAALDAKPDDPSARRDLDGHHERLGQSLRALGRARDAARVARERLSLWVNDPRAYYRAASELAQCVPLVDARTSEERRFAEDLATESIALLRRALETGWRDIHAAAHDSVFEAVRGRRDYKDLVGDWLDRLWPASLFAR